MTDRFSSLCEKLESLLCTGELEAARRELKALGYRKVPRSYRARLATLARRANLPGLGVRLLNPIVRAGRKEPVTATHEEILAYAACLARIGAHDEALTLLKPLNAEKVPEVYFVQTIALVASWNYEATIPLLTKYIASPLVSQMQRLNGEANLAAALVAEEKHAEATPLIEALIEKTAQEGLTRLHGIGIELAAQNAILQKNWQRAKECVERAEKVLGQSDLHAFFVRKWKCLLGVLKNGFSPSSRTELDSLRQEARRLSLWETLRECDRIEATVTSNKHLMAKVYFGTESEAYRRKLLKAFGLVELPESYDWVPGHSPASGLDTLDLVSGERTLSKQSLTQGDLVHRLLIAMSADFYLPTRLATLHHRLYPGEFFNPNSSPNRLHRAFNRCREWCESTRFPLKIEAKRGYFRFAA